MKCLLDLEVIFARKQPYLALETQVDNRLEGIKKQDQAFIIHVKPDLNGDIIDYYLFDSK